MIKTVVKDLVNLFKLQDNELFVDPVRLAFALNNKILNVNLISSDVFKDRNVNDCKEIISNILNLTIDKRLELLGEEQAKNILKDILIQNLDFQWTKHLDLIVKLREGVTLRSLEQRSPLNIYVQEAD
jgi:preprotein translocase subunit SecA